MQEEVSAAVANNKDISNENDSKEVQQTNGTSDSNPVAPEAPAQADNKLKKKRANPVYITPIGKKKKVIKTMDSDSDNEDGITGDDSAWGPGGKRKKGGKKKGAGKGKGRKSKKDDDSD